MSTESIENQVKQVIAEHLGVSATQVTDQARFSEELGADSLDALDLLMAINEKFGVQVEAEDLPNINTVKDMVAAVIKHRAG